jgi:hypothetical protein
MQRQELIHARQRLEQLVLGCCDHGRLADLHQVVVGRHHVVLQEQQKTTGGGNYIGMLVWGCLYAA